MEKLKKLIQEFRSILQNRHEIPVSKISTKIKHKKFLILLLEEKGIVSKEPNPAYVFLLSFAYLSLWFITLIYNTFLTDILLFVTIFSFAFAFVHWYIVRFLKKMN